MKFISYKCEFAGKINELHILISEKSNREIPGFFKISRDISRLKIKPGSRELNPSSELAGQTLIFYDSIKDQHRNYHIHKLYIVISRSYITNFKKSCH